MKQEIEKGFFLKTCKQCMGEYLTETTVWATISTMSSIALSNYNDNDVLPEAVIATCLNTLFERVRIMKGLQMAVKFSDQLNERLQIDQAL